MPLTSSNGKAVAPFSLDDYTVIRAWQDKEGYYYLDLTDPARDLSYRVGVNEKMTDSRFVSLVEQILRQSADWKVTPSLSAGMWGAIRRSLLRKAGYETLDDRTLYIIPDQKCKFCQGYGLVYDTVPYGSGSASLPSLCNCIEAQIPADCDDWEVEIVGI